MGPEDNLVSLDGNVYFPAEFASSEFTDNMEKRRILGLKKSKKLGKLKSGSTQMGSNVVSKMSTVSRASPTQLAARLTENHDGEDS